MTRCSVLSLCLTLSLLVGALAQPASPEHWTYTLTESSTTRQIWTTPSTVKIEMTQTTPPSATASGLSCYCAKNEYEPVQFAFAPASGNIKLTVAPFDTLHANHSITVHHARFVEGVVEQLTLLDLASDVISLSSDDPTVLWLTLYVPAGATPGAHSTTVTVESDTTFSLPLNLYVFDFELPERASYGTQMNIAVSQPDEVAKNILFEHRMTSKSVSWPSGFKPQITWDSAENPNRCTSFYEEPVEETPRYSIGSLARKYLDGVGWKYAGFPTSMLFQFEDNSTPRVSTFCGQDIGEGHYGTTAYNEEYGLFLAALQSYLEQRDWLERTYYYVQNEPQDAEDEKLAAHLCRIFKAAAPKLRLAISEEPKPSINEDPDGACGYDLYIAHLTGLNDFDYIWDRILTHGEELWIYSLPQDAAPYFNPTKVTLSGMNVRIIPWASWAIRATGFAYYDAAEWFPDGITGPGVRAELLREAFEDYEYLFLANGGHPTPLVEHPVDVTVSSISTGVGSWTNNAEGLHEVRLQLGLKLEGSRDDYPTLKEEVLRPRASYKINFQDPDGVPSQTELGGGWLQLGWLDFNEFGAVAPYYCGWLGGNVGTSIVKNLYDDIAGYTPQQKSVIYDDYGRRNTFQFALENGLYNVTIGIGRPRGTGDLQTAIVEGETLVDDALLNGQGENPTTTTVSTVVDLKDGYLTFEMGGSSAGQDSYCFAQFLLIEPTGSVPPTPPPCPQGFTCNPDGSVVPDTPDIVVEGPTVIYGSLSLPPMSSVTLSSTLTVTGNFTMPASGSLNVIVQETATHTDTPLTIGECLNFGGDLQLQVDEVTEGGEQSVDLADYLCHTGEFSSVVVKSKSCQTLEGEVQYEAASVFVLFSVVEDTCEASHLAAALPLLFCGALLVVSVLA